MRSHYLSENFSAGYSLKNRLGSHFHLRSIYVYVAASVGILIVIGSLVLLSFRSGSVLVSPNLCKEPPIRREWRSLALSEKTVFTQAVNCLSTKPSRWGGNGTLYDDFALLHGTIGSWCWFIQPRRYLLLRNDGRPPFSLLLPVAQIHPEHLGNGTQR